MAKRLAGVMAILVEGACRGYLTPKLAMDANIDLTSVVKDVTTANFTELKPQLAERIKALCDGKLAQDADLSDVVEMLDALEDNKKEVAEAIEGDINDPDDGTPDNGDDTPVPGGEPDDEADDEEEDLDGGETETDPVARLTEFLKGKLSEEDMSRVQAIIDGDSPDEDGSVESNPEDDNEDDEDKDKDMVTKPAMDAAIQAAVRTTEQAMVARYRAVREAEKAVFPFVGQVDGMAMDSAASVYKVALDANGVDLKGVPEAAYPAMVKMLKRPGLREVPGGGSPNKLGMDAKDGEDYKKLVGDLSHIKRR